MCVCGWMNVTCRVKRFEWLQKVEKCQINASPFAIYKGGSLFLVGAFRQFLFMSSECGVSNFNVKKKFSCFKLQL